MRLLTLFRPKPRTDLNVRMVEGGGAHSRPGMSALERYQVRSLVAGGMTIDGNISSQNGAALDGVVNGDVCVRNANAALLVRETAVVNGSVRAPIIMVCGEINGDIEGRFVRLYPGSRVSGAIRAARLIVDDGAHILGPGVAISPALEARVAPPEPAGENVRPLRPQDRAQQMIDALP